MAWAEQWTLKVDGTNLNDRVNYLGEIPEIDSLQQDALIMAEIAGDYPVFVRAQPQAGRFTINVALKSGVASAAAFRTRLTAAMALLSGGGVRHQLTVQVRGMTAEKSLYFYRDGALMVDYKRRIISARAVAPRPVLE